MTLNILAGIAELEGALDHETCEGLDHETRERNESRERAREEARGYRRRERETFAQFAGNRWHIDNDFGALIRAIAAVAQGDTSQRAAIEAALPQLEAKGWMIADANRRIWAGERDWHALCAGLDSQDALVILHVLETLAEAVKG